MSGSHVLPTQQVVGTWGGGAYPPPWAVMARQNHRKLKFWETPFFSQNISTTFLSLQLSDGSFRQGETKSSCFLRKAEGRQKKARKPHDTFTEAHRTFPTIFTRKWVSRCSVARKRLYTWNADDSFSAMKLSPGKFSQNITAVRFTPPPVLRCRAARSRRGRARSLQALQAQEQRHMLALRNQTALAFNASRLGRPAAGSFGPPASGA